MKCELMLNTKLTSGLFDESEDGSVMNLSLIFRCGDLENGCFGDVLGLLRGYPEFCLSFFNVGESDLLNLGI